MDWNWFFSSLSQSTAAIVGIFSAFIATKIISNQQVYNIKLNAIHRLIAESQKLVDTIGFRYFDWYNNGTLRTELYYLISNLNTNPDRRLTLEEYYNNYNFSIFIKKENVLKAIKDKIDDCIMNKEGQINNQGQGIYDISSKMMNFDMPPIIKGLTEERDKINDLITKARHNSREVNILLESTKNNPESSYLITISLIFMCLLFFAGVVCPLSYLPFQKNVAISFSNFISFILSVKGILLSIISIIFISIMIVFFYINHKMKYKNEEIDKLEPYKELKYYSEYFEIMIENENSNSRVE